MKRNLDDLLKNNITKEESIQIITDYVNSIIESINNLILCVEDLSNRVKVLEEKKISETLIEQ